MKKILLVIGLLAMLAAMYMVFVYVPTERVMGIVQRNFYLMVPVAWLAMLSFGITFVGSILYLAKKDIKWDVLAYSAAQSGIVFTSLALIVGSLWAKPIWGVWWDWEPRLTSTLILWFIYLAYFMVRALATEEYRGASFSAVIGIVGFIDVPIIAFSTTLWRGVHPGELVFQSGGLAPQMTQTLMVSIFAFTILFVLMVWQRISLRNAEIEISYLKQQRE
jgi:heme exporter protein C